MLPITRPRRRSGALVVVWALLVAACEHLVAIVAPPTCAACAARVAVARAFCGTCAAALEPLPRGDGAPRDVNAPFAYGGPLAVAIRAFKYGGRPDLARPLGHLLRAFLRASPVAVDLVVPVPIHPRRLVERGHDQTALLARHVADELGVPMAAALERVAHGPAQASLSREARRLGTALRFVAPRPLVGRRVLLVDDVVTTGATVEACRAALLAAGAARVEIVALARTLTHAE